MSSPIHPASGAPNIVRAGSVSAEEGRYPAPFDAEGLSFGSDLGRAAGSERFGVWHEVLPPGRRTSRAHAHSDEEEAVYVLSGPVVLRWAPRGGEFTEIVLETGDFVSFPAGTGVAHHLRNPGPGEATLLVVGTRAPADRCTYPEDPELEAWRAEHRPQRCWVDEAPLPWPARAATPRLHLRPWQPHEARALWGLARANAESLQPWMPWAWSIPSVSAYLGLVTDWARAALERRELVFGIFTPDGQPLGNVGLHPRGGPGSLEVGYWLAESARGRGYVTEATAAMVQLAIRCIGVERVELHCHPENHRSAAVARRLGFTYEATLPRRVADGRGGRHDVMVHSLYAEQLDASPAAAFDVRAWDPLGRVITLASP
jgi:uncharacterized cupin superfamily protein